LAVLEAASRNPGLANVAETIQEEANARTTQASHQPSSLGDQSRLEALGVSPTRSQEQPRRDDQESKDRTQKQTLNSVHEKQARNVIGNKSPTSTRNARNADSPRLQLDNPSVSQHTRSGASSYDSQDPKNNTWAKTSRKELLGNFDQVDASAGFGTSSQPRTIDQTKAAQESNSDSHSSSRPKSSRGVTALSHPSSSPSLSRPRTPLSSKSLHAADHANNQHKVWDDHPHSQSSRSNNNSSEESLGGYTSDIDATDTGSVKSTDLNEDTNNCKYFAGLFSLAGVPTDC
jgi:hypothetical protein